ncbi:MAG: KEOPS complex subunit Pcc1 [Promethearchaeota archaeon]
MNQNNSFSINTVIEMLFADTQTRDISYNSFIPEIQNLQTKRSSIIIEKKNKNVLIFKIKNNDITAFRASMNEIISFGKIIDNTIKLTNIS